ncbi:hypothetical protein WMF24_01490 [Sorangium sp. So ce1335]
MPAQDEGRGAGREVRAPRCLLGFFRFPLLLRVALRALLLLGGLLALHLSAMLLAALLLGGLLALELGASLLTALLLGGLLALELGASLLTALLLGGLLALELGASLLTALLLGGLLALLLRVALRALLLLGGLRALLLGGLRALLLGGLRALLLSALLLALLLGALLLAGLLLLRLQQRAEELLGGAQVLLELRAQLDEVGPEIRVLRALDVRLVEELEGAAVKGDLGPDERDVELCAFVLLQRFFDLDRIDLELLALRAGLDADRGAPRQPDPVLLSPGVLVDHPLSEALHLRRLGLLQRDLRQLELLPVDERDQRRDLPMRHLPHRAVTAGLLAAALAALEAGLLAARLLLSTALPAPLEAGLSAALPAGLFAAALPAARASARAPRAIAACLAAAPAVSVRAFTAAALAAGRRLAVRLGLFVTTGDAPASSREYKAPCEHDRREAT